MLPSDPLMVFSCLYPLLKPTVMLLKGGSNDGRVETSGRGIGDGNGERRLCRQHSPPAVSSGIIVDQSKVPTSMKTGRIMGSPAKELAAGL